MSEPPPTSTPHVKGVSVFTSLLGLTHLSLALSTWSQASALLGEGGLSFWGARASELSPSLLTFLSNLTPLSMEASLNVTLGLWTLSALTLTLRVASGLSALVCLLSALALHQAGGELVPTSLALLTHEATLLSLLFFTSQKRGSAVGAWVGRALLFKVTLITALYSLGEPLWASLKALYVQPWTQALPHAGAASVMSLPEWALMWGASLTLYAQLCVPWLLLARVRRPALVWGATLAFSAVSAWSGRAPTLLSPELWLWALVALASDERVSAHLPQRARALTETFGPHLNLSWAAALPLGLLALAPHLTGSHGPSLLLMWGLIALTFEQEPREGERSPQAGAIQVSEWVRLALLSGWCVVSITGYPQGLSQGLISHQLIGYESQYSEGSEGSELKTSRTELLIEVSADGVRWAPLRSPYSPNASSQAPAWAGLHLPYLDLALWREAQQPACRGGWLFTLLERLLEPSQEPQEPQETQAPQSPHKPQKTTHLELWSALDVSLPELGAPPRWARVRRVRYELVLREGRFWRARDAGVFCPALSLPELRQALARERALPPLPFNR